MDASVSRRRPPLLIAIGVLFLAVLPVVNFVVRARVLHIALTAPLHVVASFSGVEKAILAGSIVVGAGVLAVQRWGWWLFVVYAPLFAIYDLYLFKTNPILFNIGALAETVVAFAAMAYFLRRDIYAPFLAEEDRGFRDMGRFDITVPIVVDDVKRRTRDVSEDGCFVIWRTCPHEVGHIVTVDLEFGGERFVRESAEIVRKTPEGVGIYFNRRATIARFKVAVKRVSVRPLPPNPSEVMPVAIPKADPLPQIEQPPASKRSGDG